jgi:hypothetical protein
MVAFDIRYLLIPEITEKYNALSNFDDKVEFLFKLLSFDIYFKKYTDKINENWIKEVGKQYSDEDYAFMINEKAFVIEYACKTYDDNKIFDLINKLCNPENCDHDTVVADAEKYVAVITNIDDFEFSDDLSDETTKQKQPVRKTSLDVLLRFQPKK